MKTGSYGDTAPTGVKPEINNNNDYDNKNKPTNHTAVYLYSNTGDNND